MAGRAHRAAGGVSGTAARGHSPGKEEAESGRQLLVQTVARKVGGRGGG